MDLHKSAVISENVFLGVKNLVMKKGTIINVGSFVDGSAPVVLDEYVRVGPYVKNLTGTHQLRNSSLRRWPSDPVIAESVHIKKGCWIGIGVTILPGVTIAEGCVIGAGAVVNANSEPHGLYVGVPARRENTFL